MKCGSVCSGIGAPETAWTPLGMEFAFSSEIDKFPSAVHALRFPDIPNYGDMEKFNDWPDADIDVLVGGTPCQSFSIAGLRKGLDDPRGNLALVYLAIARRYRPRWLVWENVPGVLSSDEGRDFGALLGGLEELGYGWAYRTLDAQYVRVESHPHAVPQRRRRVFVVGYLGGWRGAAAVLFESESLSGNSPPRREAGEGTAPTIAARTRGGGGLDVYPTLSSNEGGTLTQIPPITFAQNQRDELRGMDVAGAIASQPGMKQQTHVAFTSKDHGADAMDNLSPTLRSGGHDTSHANAGVMPAVAFESRYVRNGRGALSDVVPPLKAQSGETGKGDAAPLTIHDMSVRRLTVEECESLMGLPRGFTKIPWRGKPADQCPDGPRYKALGNSMAVNVMSWIGQRLLLADTILEAERMT